MFVLSRSHVRRSVVGAIAGAVFVAASGFGAVRAAEITTYTTSVTIPVPPASSFTASAGGDGWDVALSDTQVFNVFHHQASTQVVCHNQTDASKCWAGPKTVVDGAAHQFGASGLPGLHIAPSSGMMYSMSVRDDGVAGALCIDITLPPEAVDLYCGFVPLASASSNYMDISAPMVNGSRVYAYLYKNSVAPNDPGGANRMLCFDVATNAPCAGQPFAVSVNTTNPGEVTSVNTFPTPAIGIAANRIIVPSQFSSGTYLGCFDTSTNADCGGSWPVTAGTIQGTPFALPTAGGGIAGICQPNSTLPCFALDGTALPTPSGLAALASEFSSSTGWNDGGVQLGSRILLPLGSADEIFCYSAATDSTCDGYPRATVGASYIYSLNPDPQRPGCLWINADSGVNQIQNFDAFTGGPCGGGVTRVFASRFVVDSELCRPTDWTRLQVTDPAPGSYTGATLEFLDEGGSAIPGLAATALDAAGAVGLSGLGLSSKLPQFVITFDGLADNQGAVTIDLTWTATEDTSCLASGATADFNDPPTGLAGGPYTGIEGSAVQLTGSTSDADGDPVSISWRVAPGAGTDAGASCTFNDPARINPTLTCTDDGTYNLTMTYSDGRSTPLDATTTVEIANAPPSVKITAPNSNAQATTGTPIGLSASLGDPGANDTHTCSIAWGDGVTSAGTVSGGVCVGNHAYANVGDRAITVTVTDDDGAAAVDTVNIRIAAPAIQPPGQLPATGSSGITAALAALFTAAGIALTWAARRRRVASVS